MSSDDGTTEAWENGHSVCGIFWLTLGRAKYYVSVASEQPEKRCQPIAPMLKSVTGWIKDKKLRFTRLCRGTTDFASILASEKHQNGRDMQEMIDEIRAYQVHWKACIIAIVAKVAKSDGVVSPAEIAVADELFEMMGFTQENRAEAIRIFKHAKDSPTSLFHTAVGIRDVCNLEGEAIVFLTVCAFIMAHADGNLSLQSKDNLLTICDVFHLLYDDCFKMYRDSDAARQSEKEAYNVIGCKKSDSDEIVKERYRTLVKDFHPDRVSPKELAPDFVKFAEEKFKKIQAACETIIERRARSGVK